MSTTPTQPRRPRGQAKRATVRLGPAPLTKNLVIRCSDELYETAVGQARSQERSLSDYIRRLILDDLKAQPAERS